MVGGVLAPDLAGLLASPSFQSAKFGNAWRASHASLSFAEEKTLWDVVFPKIAAQRCATVVWHRDVLQSRPRRRVLELGSYDGWLANACSAVGIESWVGYELCGWAVDRSMQGTDNRELLMPFWMLHDLPAADIFLSSHTLEHLTDREVEMVLDVVAPRVTDMILEVPWHPDGWHDYRGSHILSMTPEDLVDAVRCRWDGLHGGPRRLSLLALDYSDNGKRSTFEVEVP